MTTYNRGEVTVSTRVGVSADEFWTVLRDWGSVLDWVLPPESPDPPVAVALKLGHDVDTLPCTRVLEFDPPLGFPYEETLLFSYPEARRIYYTFNGIPGGLCNYMATTYVESDSENAATVTCSSTWDLPSSQPIEELRAYLAAVYEHMIARGIEGTVLARQSAR
jgi:hypothetical protein